MDQTINKTMMENKIEELKGQARRSWSGEEGERRAEKLESYLRKKLKHYAHVLDMPEEEILNAWEKRRDYVAINYYQECNQPDLMGKNVRVFDTVEDLQESIGEKKFRCPSCEGISTEPYECDTKKKDKSGKECNWKSYGLFGTLGKGAHVFVKDKMQSSTFFMPIKWEEGRENDRSES